MVFLSRTVLLVTTLFLVGCGLFDDDDKPPHFIFRCADTAGCGHDDEDTIYGNGEVFGTVYMNRAFEIYYGTIDNSAWNEDGGINEYSVNAAEDIEVISGSPYRLGSYQPFQASAAGLTVILALNDAGEVIDYMYIDARPGPAATNPNTPDADPADTETDLDAGVDGNIDGGTVR